MKILRDIKKLIAQRKGKELLSMQVVYVNEGETKEQALKRLNSQSIETPRPLFVEWI